MWPVLYARWRRRIWCRRVVSRRAQLIRAIETGDRRAELDAEAAETKALQRHHYWIREARR